MSDIGERKGESIFLGGRLFKSFRHLGSFTLREASERSGLGSGYLSQLETDTIQDPSVSKLPAIAIAYAVPVEVVLSAYGIKVDIGSPGGIDAQTLAISESLGRLTPKNKAMVIGFAEYLMQHNVETDE